MKLAYVHIDKYMHTHSVDVQSVLSSLTVGRHITTHTDVNADVCMVCLVYVRKVFLVLAFS